MGKKKFQYDHELPSKGITGHKRIIFDLLKRDMDLENRICLNSELRREYMACTSSKADPLIAMKGILRSLVKAGVIVRSKRATYRVNPRYGTIGDYKDSKIKKLFKEEQAAMAADGLY